MDMLPCCTWISKASYDDDITRGEAAWPLSIVDSCFAPQTWTRIGALGAGVWG